MKVVLLQRYNKNAAIMRVTDDGIPVGCQPFVYAYGYDALTTTWRHGHYFQNLEDLGVFIKKEEK